MRSLLYWVFVSLLYVYIKLLLILVVAKPNGKRSKQCIFVANHPNLFDPMYVLPIIRKRVTVLITEHAFNVPIFGTLLRYTNQIRVTSDKHAVYEEALKQLRSGASILLFPEGQNSKGNKLAPFHTGAVRLSMESNVPIVPIGIYLDPAWIWRKNVVIRNIKVVFAWYRYGWYGVTFGKEICIPGSVEDRLFVQKQTSALRQTVVRLSRNARKACEHAILLGKRKNTVRFHNGLRLAYRVVCFLFFTRIH